MTRIVALHALPFGGDMWSAVVAALGGDVETPTLYGRGSTLESCARALLDEYGDDDLVLVGNSTGGSCAVEMAYHAPDRVRALVLVGAKPGHRPDPVLRDEAAALLESGDVETAWARYWLPIFGPAADSARWWPLVRPVSELATGVAAFHARVDREAFLVQWPGRVVVVRGEHDVVDIGFARRCSNARIVELPGVGHYVPLEAPDVLAGVITDAVSDL